MLSMGLLKVDQEISFFGINFGLECSGTVSKVSANESEFKVGDRVVALAKNCFSSYSSPLPLNRTLESEISAKKTYLLTGARYVKTPSILVAKIPDNMTFEVAASIPLTFCTAFQALCNKAQIEKGEKVLIHAAAGGTGL
jgi:NADPH:quinone reductase-like Zn-dependent oxidoreductase